MKRFAVIAAVALAALGWAGSALAGTPDGIAGPWADYVVQSNQGCAFIPPDMTTCATVPPQRSNPLAALGPAESPAGQNQNIPEGSFFSIGFTDPSRGTAFITLGFDNPICNVAGADVAIDVFEITQEPYPPEVVSVFVSADNVNYFFAGTVSKDGTVALPAAVPVANFVRLVDATPRGPFAATTIVADGFDVDGVRAISTNRCPGGDFGKIEICKSSANGMSGKSFQFSLNGGTPITVKGGRCTGAITAISGREPGRRAPEQPADGRDEHRHATEQPADLRRLTEPDRRGLRATGLDGRERDDGHVHERACGRDGR